MVTVGLPRTPSRLHTARKGGGAALASARAADFAGPILDEVEAGAYTRSFISST